MKPQPGTDPIHKNSFGSPPFEYQKLLKVDNCLVTGLPLKRSSPLSSVDNPPGWW
jgi:hypothetical protein